MGASEVCLPVALAKHSIANGLHGDQVAQLVKVTIRLHYFSILVDRLLGRGGDGRGAQPEYPLRANTMYIGE